MEREPIKEGDWAFETWMEPAWRGDKRIELPRRTPVLVRSIEGDKALVEHWEIAKITRRTKAFGQRIDKSPYRVGGVHYVALDDLRPMPAGMARREQANIERVMRYPTYGERRYRREKARGSR